MCTTCTRVAEATKLDTSPWHLGTSMATAARGGLPETLGLDALTPSGPTGGGNVAGAFLDDKGLSGFTETSDVGDTIATAQRVAVNETVIGNLSSVWDDDMYAVSLQAGQTYTITLDGRGASGLPDPLLGVFDAGGNLVGYDDDGGANLNSRLEFTATSTSTFYVLVDDFYDDPGAYTLRVSGAGGGTPPGGGDGNPPGGGGDDDIGETVGTARRIQLDQNVRSTIGSSTDEDMFAVTIRAGQSYRITLEGDAGTANPLSDPLVRVFDAAGREVAFNDDSNGTRDSSLVYTAPANGTLYVQADAYSTQTGAYVLRVEETAAPPVPGGPVETITWDFQAPQVIDVYFAPGNLTVVEGRDTVVTTHLDATERAAINSVLSQYESVIDVDFRITNDPSQAEFVFLEGNLPGLYGIWNIGMDYGAGVIDGTRYDNLQGIGHFNSADPSWNPANLQQGGFAYAVIMHELGHGMGMAHPHDVGGGSTIMPGVFGPRGDYGPSDLNQGVYTVMSYNDGWQTAPHGQVVSNAYGHQGSLMALDIARLQAAYGANTGTAAGNDVYLLPNGNTNGTFYSSIWDTGGTDTISANGTSRVVTIDLTAATLDFSATGGGVMSYAEGIHGGFTIAAGVVIENATGGRNHDTLRGNGTANTLRGEGGNDVLEGMAGNDVLRGGDGRDELFGGDSNDILFGDAGADLLDGGRGFDYVSYTASTRSITIDAMDGGRNAGDAAGDRLQLVENLVGSNFADTIWGGNVANELLGRAGNDRIDGRGGADMIDGGAGADILTGGQGYDTFRYQLTGESRVGSVDRITDFARGIDTIDLSRIDAVTTRVGDQAFSFVGTAAFSGTAGELRYGRGGDDVSVIGDTNGDGVADFVFVLEGVAQVSAGDFTL